MRLKFEDIANKTVESFNPSLHPEGNFIGRIVEYMFDPQEATVKVYVVNNDPEFEGKRLIMKNFKTNTDNKMAQYDLPKLRTLFQLFGFEEEIDLKDIRTINDKMLFQDIGYEVKHITTTKDGRNRKFATVNNFFKDA